MIEFFYKDQKIDFSHNRNYRENFYIHKKISLDLFCSFLDESKFIIFITYGTAQDINRFGFSYNSDIVLVTVCYTDMSGWNFYKFFQMTISDILSFQKKYSRKKILIPSKSWKREGF